MLPGFLSTLSLRRATGQGHAFAPPVSISIHALLAESDLRGWTLNINGPIFLSTLSLRRATGLGLISAGLYRISIHALLAESDALLISSARLDSVFLSTLSLRRATRLTNAQRTALVISIHALLAESDFMLSFTGMVLPISIHALLAESDSNQINCTSVAANFYPRSPCGERPFMASPMRMIVGFLSTLSLRRATCWCAWGMAAWIFLSTLSLRRATAWRQEHPTLAADFYPRSPCGERRRALR